MYFRSVGVSGTARFRAVRTWPLVLVLAQVLLGILTVSYADTASVLLWLGVAHQFVAMLLLMSLIYIYFLVTARKASQA
jgi:heme A synthase